MSAFDENPFADPSVQAASGAGPTLSDYDPFSGQQAPNSGGQPAVMSPTSVDAAPPPIPSAQSSQPPPYTQTAQQTATTADFQDINVDIPVEFQDVVKKLYYLWLAHALLLLLNL